MALQNPDAGAGNKDFQAFFPSGGSLWAQADSLIAKPDRARAEGVEITADVYPYPYRQSTLRVLLPEGDYEDRTAAEYALREVATPENLVLGRWQPDSSYIGKTLAELARLRRVDPASLLVDLIREAQAAEAAGATEVESVIGTSMTDADVQRLMAGPQTAVSSDGEFAGRHPRGRPDRHVSVLFEQAEEPRRDGEIVERVLAFFEPQAKQSDIEFIRFLDPALPSIKLDEQTLHAALLNLVKNSLEAMPDGGQLLARTLLTRHGVAPMLAGFALAIAGSMLATRRPEMPDAEATAMEVSEGLEASDTAGVTVRL